MPLQSSYIIRIRRGRDCQCSLRHCRVSSSLIRLSQSLSLVVGDIFLSSPSPLCVARGSHHNDVVQSCATQDGNIAVILLCPSEDIQKKPRRPVSAYSPKQETSQCRVRLVQCHRWWTNLNPTLFQYLMLTGHEVFQK